MIHAVTNDRWEPERLAAFAKKLLPWVDRIHLREKRLGERETAELAEALLKAGIPPERLIVHRFPQIADEYRLYGAHFPESGACIEEIRKSYPEMKIGQSVHSPESGRSAEEAGADYLYYGHVFPSASKPGLEPRGLGKLAGVAEAVSIPVIAIGGINSENGAEVLQAGASGIGAISVFFPPDQSLEEARKLSFFKEVNVRGGNGQWPAASFSGSCPDGRGAD